MLLPYLRHYFLTVFLQPHKRRRHDHIHAASGLSVVFFLRGVLLAAIRKKRKARRFSARLSSFILLYLQRQMTQCPRRRTRRQACRAFQAEARRHGSEIRLLPKRGRTRRALCALPLQLSPLRCRRCGSPLQRQVSSCSRRRQAHRRHKEAKVLQALPL